MTIGEKIKDLRIAQNVTQERLARALRISPQAVSKWENGTGNPDVTMIAPLCCFFGVSADELCGVENARLDEIFRENEAKSRALYDEGKIGELLAFWRDAAAQYPRHWPTLSRLMFACFAAAHTFEKVPDGEDRDALTGEVIRLGEEILAECGDEEVRDFAVMFLTPEYLMRDQTERVQSIVRHSHGIHVSRQFLLRYIAEGEEWENNARDLLMTCLTTSADLLTQADPSAWPPAYFEEVSAAVKKIGTLAAEIRQARSGGRRGENT